MFDAYAEGVSPSSDVVTIVGAGMAGAACAAVLRAAEVPFRLVERGRAVGGRMASPLLHGRRVDVGAGYFTVRDPEFADVVERWHGAGSARPWTDTFGVLTPGAAPGTSAGPIRWATPDGLRSLVREILDGIEVDREDVTELPEGDVVLAMPDPQAGRLTLVPDAVDYDPVIAVVLGFDSLVLPFRDAAFVNDHPDIQFLADDGARRGDSAPVLVAHTTPECARAYLQNPDSAVEPVVRALREVLDSPTPTWTHAHRWSFGKPAGYHPHTFSINESGGRTIGFAGDQWSPTGPPRVESAWRSGTDLGRALAALRL